MLSRPNDGAKKVVPYSLGVAKRGDVYAEHRRRTMGAIVVAVAAVAGCVALVVLLLTRDATPPVATDYPSPPPSSSSFLDEETAAPEVEPYKPTLQQAMGRLADRNRPFNILALGDSTALDSINGWHVKTMAWLSATTGRPWTLSS